MFVLAVGAGAAAAQTPPTIEGNPGVFFGPDAYPRDALQAGEQGRVVTRLTVGPDGAVTGCSVTTSSGSTSLDAATCRIAMARMHFAPARDTRGGAVAADYMLPVRWVLPRASGEPLIALTLRLTMRIAPDRAVGSCAASVNGQPIPVQPGSCATYAGLFSDAVARAGTSIDATIERSQGYGAADTAPVTPPGVEMLTEITTRFQVGADGHASGCHSDARGGAVVLPVANPCDGRTRFAVAGASTPFPLAARWTTTARYKKVAP